MTTAERVAARPAAPSEASTAGTAPGAPGPRAAGNGTPARATPPLLHAATILVVVLVIALAGVLSLGARAVNNSNENRLLRQRAVEVGAVLAAILPVVQTPLASAVEVAEATNARPANFDRVMA